MNRVHACLLWLAMALCAGAWAQEDASQPSDRFAAERQRIAAIRSQKTSELDAQEQACTSKFAVTDCQQEVRARRRQMLADLKRQENAINAIEHQQKGEEALQSRREKAAEHEAHQAELQADAEHKSQEGRQKDLDDKVLNHKNQAHPAETKPQKSTSILDAQEVEKNRVAYADKLKELDKRRQERDDNVKKQGTPKSAPLPAPP